MSAIFPHQAAAEDALDGNLWTVANLCLTEGWTLEERLGGRTEPLEADTRLLWHVERAMEWIRQAAAGTLLVDGDRYELPAFGLMSAGRPSIAYSEGPSSLPLWLATRETFGRVELLEPLKPGLPIVVNRFDAANGHMVRSTEWGIGLLDLYTRRFNGAWIRLKDTPSLPPWKAPTSWSELRQAVVNQGLDLDALLSNVIEELRGVDPRVLLVGFPVPEYLGDANKKMHWQAIQLPQLAPKTGSLPGFRNNPGTRWQVDRLRSFRNQASIAWMRSEDWSPEELSGRGALPAFWCEQRILIIGAGALGSAVAELLTRAGCRHFVIEDADTLAAGNLVRHTALLSDVGTGKAETVSARLRGIAPLVEARELPKRFPPLDESGIAAVRSCGIIIDCTANDDVLAELAGFDWGGSQRWFVSFSLGHQARRLFAFAAYRDEFPATDFNEAFQPWLEREAVEHENDDLPAEFIGCWQPLFPARVDDVWLMAASAVKSIERICEGADDPGFVVFERLEDEHGFAGLQRVTADE